MHLLILTALIGFLSGLVARWITPGCGLTGFILTTMLGVAGALAASFLGQLLRWYQPGQSAGWIGAMMGAVILLAGHHLLMRER